jgi:hypothetical protein
MLTYAQPSKWCTVGCGNLVIAFIPSRYILRISGRLLVGTAILPGMRPVSQRRQTPHQISQVSHLSSAPSLGGSGSSAILLDLNGSDRPIVLLGYSFIANKSWMDSLFTASPHFVFCLYPVVSSSFISRQPKTGHQFCFKKGESRVGQEGPPDSSDSSRPSRWS